MLQVKLLIFNNRATVFNY